MANTLLPLGTLNKVVGSLVVQDYPELNAIASNLTKAGIQFSLQGNLVEQIEAMTGVVQSPNPYVQAEITINLVRTQPIVETYRKQILQYGVIGSIDVYPDVQGPGLLSKYSFRDCAIMTHGEMAFNGADPTYSIHIRGTYDVNAAMWP